MNEWQMLATRSPASGQWRHYPATMRPDAIFAWAEPGRAYAGQVVAGVDGRYYFYASVVEEESGAKDRFAIGVAVADSPLGPWRDAHPEGPLLSPRVTQAHAPPTKHPTAMVSDNVRI